MVIVHTIKGAEAEGTTKIQSFELNDHRISERKPKSLHDPDYGCAIKLRSSIIN